MDQRIGFCTTSDDVRIAYAVVGADGPPVVYAAGFPTHLEIEWERPGSRDFLETLSAGATLVRYDMRGCGLSDGDVHDFSLDTLVRDLDAVVEACGFGSFALLSLGMLAGPIAMTYAAANPNRVSQLVLCSAFARGERINSPDRQRALIDYTEKFGVPVLELAESLDPAAGMDRTGRDIVHLAASRATQASLLRTFYACDVTPELPRLTMPVTVLHGRGDRLVPFAEGRDLAAQLPHATFIPLSGNTGAALTEQAVTIPAIRQALGLTAQPARATPAPASVVTILFTDLESSTEITSRLGDAAGQDLLRIHDRIVREALQRHGGSEIKHTGDGIMVSFGSPAAALDCAIEIQRAVAGHAAAHPDSPLAVHIGLNAGEPVSEDAGLFGTSVQLARRICDRAKGGEILLSNVVRELAAGKNFLFADRGENLLKGFEDAVRLYELRWREDVLAKP